MMETALTYMLNVWDDLLKYRHRGDYTVDNMVAERAIRPFTVSRRILFTSAVRRVSMWL